MLMTDLWEKCYDDSWKNEITPEAFSHPAKFSRGLIRRIYAHMEAEGWLPENGIILDPFGGVALGGLDACLHGLTWVGIELEPRFCVLAEQNIALWNKRYSGKMPRWGSATILNGDSRNLAAILQGQAEGAVSSPPFAEVIGHDGGKEHMPKIGNFGLEYGHSDGQLGAMKFTEAGLAGAVSSPPYAETVMGANSKSIDRQKQWETYRASGGGQSFDAFCHTQDLHSQDYGHSEGQLGAMKPGDFEAAAGASVSSPPFERSDSRGGTKMAQNYFDAIGGIRTQDDFSNFSNNSLCNSTPTDFWSASRTILDQLYSVLAPGGEPRPDGENIDFCDCA